MQTDRITTVPDTDAIERALLRVRATAGLLEKLADAFGTSDFAEAMVLMANDLTAAHEALRDVPGHLMAVENGRAAA